MPGPAASLSWLAPSVASAVTLKTADPHVDAASVLWIMTAGIGEGETVTVQCEGGSARSDLATISPPSPLGDPPR